MGCLDGELADDDCPIKTITPCKWEIVNGEICKMAFLLK